MFYLQDCHCSQMHKAKPDKAWEKWKRYSKKSWFALNSPTTLFTTPYICPFMQSANYVSATHCTKACRCRSRASVNDHIQNLNDFKLTSHFGLKYCVLWCAFRLAMIKKKGYMSYPRIPVSLHQCGLHWLLLLTRSTSYPNISSDFFSSISS